MRKRRPKGTPFQNFEVLSAGGGSGSALDELHRIAERLDRLGSVIGNFDSEFFLERHNQFNGIKAVCTKIVDERRILGDLVFFNAQMLDDDLARAIFDVAHVSSSQFFGSRPVVSFKIAPWDEKQPGLEKAPGWDGVAYTTSPA
jgi:hypothetical protein